MNPVVQRTASFLHTQLRRFGGFARVHPVRAAVLGLPTILVVYLLILLPFTPSISDLRKAKAEAPSVLLATDGSVLAEYRRINRQWVTLDKISPDVVNALIATEDIRFYSHHGIDYRRVAGALLSTLKGDLQGGSTLTQQLARNRYPEEVGRSNSITRKAKEAITALKIEALYSKDEILETYLNTVPFLYNAFGIEMAARTYFDKSAAKLDVLEAATLIGMLKGTSYYNPVLNPARSQARRNLVLAQMAKNGKLDPNRVKVLSKRPLKLDFERQTEALGPAPHVAQYLRKWLISWADREDYDIETDGLKVYTTLDSRLQKAANQAVTRQMAQLQPLADGRSKGSDPHPQLQVGFLAMDPRNGAVRAWVGSRDFAKEQFDHVSQARRQPGSTFKPFVYGAAFMEGFKPEDTFIDEPVEISAPGSAVWTPSDATPPTYAPTTLSDGLAFSKNTITAQLMQQVGPKHVGQLAQALGVRHSKLDLVPSLALGTSPVTLLEMVNAYSTIANGGSYLAPVMVLRIEDRNGKVLEQFQISPEPEPAMPHADALTLVNAMRGVIDRGTGSAIRYRYGIQTDVAGKTGTTQDNTDGWFILMSPQLVAGARVGFNDNSVTMGSWGQGARSALPMVGDVFSQAFRNRWLDPLVEFDIPRPKPAPDPEPEPAPQAEAAPSTPTMSDALEKFLRELQHD